MFSMGIAIRCQQNSRTISEAKKAFNKSCSMCCVNPEYAWRRCDNCRVAEAHKCVVAELNNIKLV